MRRDGTRFGYVDPLRFMAAPTRPVPLGRAPRAGRRAPPARIVRPRRRIVRPAAPPLAPWPAWAGLALVLAGAGLRLRARRRAYSNPVVSPAER